ncbi:hypothetical protein ACV3KS_06015 [Clostridium perfringens]|uniref:hypothetical protein n=1 Tax=Clostridium perfringens TaxID=1502 RepID=UPI000A69D0E9|nr:hypothetical protein [Clostridium perfringens]EHK2327174.1 hypothetical protein [Clostridium perfringens]EJT6613109.1 hypothetical protein [Clostridium perfringens]MBO3334069.1 hypothetical protein [Clostridium perfringens]MDK0546045.1 hypothetical protein [Clostridium perfringens]MDK0685276.1 hypothetical protein [Clostridium perfringens]
MEEYIKTKISRTKLYERDYNRDSIEKIILEESQDFNNISIYKVLIDILTQKYLDNKSV